MKKPARFNPGTHTVALGRDLVAALVPERPDPPVPVDGMTFGVATMTKNSPHGGEMHADGDEVLYLVSGKVNIVFLDSPVADVPMAPGDGFVVPRGTWHRVDILEPSQIVYLTPGPNNAFRPLP